MNETNVILNGEAPTVSLLAQMAAAFEDPDVLTAHGGFLLRATVVDGVFHVGIVPALNEGQRLYHFGMDFPETPVALTGFVEPDGRFTILLARPGRPVELSEAERDLSRSLYSRFARFLLQAGVKPETKLHALTQQTLVEARLATAPPPATLAELAEVVDARPPEELRPTGGLSRH